MRESMNEIYFKFGEPKNGWMELSIIHSDEEVNLVISDVPCDSIYKLADILLSLQAGIGYEEVEFSLEPEYALCKFIVDGNDLTLEIFPESGRKNPVIFKGYKEKVIKRLYKGLRDLESLPAWKGSGSSHEAWSWDFPTSELNKFKERSKIA
jgi:hypothetical protein